MHRYRIITTLPFSKYANFHPTETQRQTATSVGPAQNQRTLWMTTSTTTTLSASFQMPPNTAGKNLFCKLDCSQAYHCLQMADQR